MYTIVEVVYMELKDIIREYKDRFQLSNKDLAVEFDVSANTITRWLHGDVKSVQDDTARKISEKIGYDISALLRGSEINFKRPILGTAKAGYNLFLEENYIGEEDVSANEYKQGDYYLQVNGDSMKDAGIMDGGLVYVKRCNYVNNGEIAIISFDEEVTIKKYYNDGKSIKLVACNGDYEPRCFTMQEAKKARLQIIGKVLFAKNYY
jgi:repressor LexA